MSTTTSISSAIRELYSAPLEAVVRAEEDYRRIWADWLRLKRELVTEKGRVREGVDLVALLQAAPAVRLDGRVDIAVTMRIASVRGTEGGGSAGLQLGPIHASGSFGFVNRTTEESVLQASTVVVISNTDQTLADYLAKHNLTVADAAGLDQAIGFLEKGAGGGGDDQ